jgi:hypothetical protein
MLRMASASTAIRSWVFVSRGRCTPHMSRSIFMARMYLLTCRTATGLTKNAHQLAVQRRPHCHQPPTAPPSCTPTLSAIFLPISARVLWALERLKHELACSDAHICSRLRTELAVM